ncbi:Hypothetical predicted protein, partial [Pelobates cultripes]
ETTPAGESKDQEVLPAPEPEQNLSLHLTDSLAPTMKGDLKIVLSELHKMMATDLVFIRKEIQAHKD